jgi:O-antigen ligase
MIAVSYRNNGYALLAPLLLLLLSALISVWAAYDPLLSWPLLFALLVGVSLFFAINWPIASPKIVAKGLVITGGLAAFYFVGQYAHFDYWTEQGRLAALGRMTGSLLPNFVFFTPHPNAVATFLEGVFLLNLVLIWRARGLARWGWASAAILIIYAILISGSRGAWLGLGLTLVIGASLLLPNPTWRLGLMSMMIGAGLLGICSLVYVASSSQQLPILESMLATWQSRLILYRNVYHLIGDYPFTGIGLGNTFAMVYSRYQLLIPWAFLTYAHNIFLAVGLGQGLLGLIALIWLLIRFYGFVVQVEWANIQDAPASLVFRAAWLGVTATFIHGLLDAAQFSADYWTLPMLFALLALAMIAGRSLPLYSGETKLALASRAIRRYPYLLPAVMGLSLIVGTVLYRQTLLGYWYANMGAVYQTQADLSPGLDAVQRDLILAKAIGYFESSLELNSAQSVANRRLGMIALDYQQFDRAVSYLEQAYPYEPENQATLKALGYAYLWTGQLEPAYKLLHQLDDQGELVEELNNWRNWWQSQHRAELSGYAGQMIRLLYTKKG